MTDFSLRVLQVISDADLHDSLWWRTDGEYAPVTWFMNVNDVFWWATADLERITPENLPILEQAIADVRAIVGFYECESPALFAARVRKMRPQGRAYPKDQRLWPLFDACGPDRGSEPGNTPRRAA